MQKSNYTLEQYFKDTQRTLPALSNPESDFMHMASGLCTELHEFKVAGDSINKIEEIGDFMWYLSNMYAINGITPPTLRQIQEFPSSAHWDSFDSEGTLYKCLLLLDIAKKYLAYKRVPDENLVITLLMQLFVSCYNTTKKVLGQAALKEKVELVFLDTLERNINKLKKRYPEKFTEYHANNRDLDAERKILES